MLENLEATGRPKKVLDNKVKDTAWVKLNRDKLMATLARAYSLFYKNSGIEITWLSPNIDMSIHFCI